jgi:hypothetical protein
LRLLHRLRLLGLAGLWPRRPLADLADPLRRLHLLRLLGLCLRLDLLRLLGRELCCRLRLGPPDLGGQSHRLRPLALHPLVDPPGPSPLLRHPHPLAL